LKAPEQKTRKQRDEKRVRKISAGAAFAYPQAGAFVMFQATDNFVFLAIIALRFGIAMRPPAVARCPYGFCAEVFSTEAKGRVWCCGFFVSSYGRLELP